MTTKSGPDLKALRQQIREIDEAILELVSRRLGCARQVAEAKLAQNLPVKDFQVEKQVIQRARERARTLGIYEDLAQDIVETLIKYSCLLQEEHQGKGRRKAAAAARRILVVGGLGGMGRWMAHYFDAFGHSVEICDLASAVEACEEGPSPMPGSFVVGSDLARQIEGVDIVVLATPISKTPALIALLARTATPALVFDICSLKSPLIPAIEQASAAGLRITSVHPMFGPGVDLLSGRNIVLCETEDPSLTEEAASLFRDSSAQLVRVPLARHDELMACVLGLSHLGNLVFAETLASQAVSFTDLERVASTTFRAQVRVTEPVVHENQHLYYEIQAENQFTPRILEGMAQSLDTYTRAIVQRDPEAFGQLMQRARRYFDERKS